MKELTEDFIKHVERAHFRTQHDTGAHPNVMLIWNIVRQHVGLTPLRLSDLATFCLVHQCYHHIKEDYGCKVEDKSLQRGFSKTCRMTPDQWCFKTGVEIVDPDGWRHGGPSWETPITWDMFLSRFNQSTVRVVDKTKYSLYKHLFC